MDENVIDTTEGMGENVIDTTEGMGENVIDTTEGMDENVIDTTDQISQLPEFIVHNMLSFLSSPTELVRVSVLSKEWFALTASFPILDFDIDKISIALHASEIPFDSFKHRKLVREKFFGYVAYAMSRFCEQNVSAHTFKLNAVIQEPTDADIFDRWIGLIVEKHVQVMVLEIRNRPFEENHSVKFPPRYRLPDTLLSATSLTSLAICRCELPSSLMVNGVKFKSLKKLSLESVAIGEEVIKYLITSCPLLEEFKVKNCLGFKRFCVYGLQNLQKVWMCNMGGVEKIDIDAPNLHYLCLTDLEGRGAPCANLASCKKLTTLSFRTNSSSKSEWLAEFISNFPHIENLFLDIPTQCNKLKVSSHSLRKFVLHPRCDLEGIEIDAPNLLLFEYSRVSNPVPFPLASISAQSKAFMECCRSDDVDALWFQKLRRFLDKKNKFKVLKLHICVGFIDVHELEVIRSAPFELEHIELKLVNLKGSSAYAAFLDVILWCCRPRSLTLRWDVLVVDFEERSFYLRFTYEKLLQQEDNIQIVLSCGSNAKRHFTDLNSLLKGLRLYRPYHIITFIKEEVV